MTILSGSEAKPSPGGKVLYDLDDPAKLARLVKGRLNRLSAERFSVGGTLLSRNGSPAGGEGSAHRWAGSYPLKVSFPVWNRADPKSDRWPIAQFAAGQS